MFQTIEINNVSQLLEDVSIGKITNDSTSHSYSFSNAPAFTLILETLFKDKEDNNNDSIKGIIDDILISSSNHCVIFEEDTHRFNDDESFAYILAERNIGIIYITYFLSITIFLYSSMSKKEYLVNSSSAFEGLLNKKINKRYKITYH